MTTRPKLHAQIREWMAVGEELGAVDPEAAELIGHWIDRDAQEAIDSATWRKGAFADAVRALVAATREPDDDDTAAVKRAQALFSRAQDKRSWTAEDRETPDGEALYVLACCAKLGTVPGSVKQWLRFLEN